MAQVGKQTRGGRIREGKVDAQGRLGFELGILCMRLRMPKRCCCLDLHYSGPGDKLGCPHHGDHVRRFLAATAMLRAGVGCFLPTLVELCPREGRGHTRRGVSLAASPRPLTANPGNLTVSSEHLLVRISRTRQAEGLGTHLCAYLIFRYLFQGFEVLGTGGPGLWPRCPLRGFTPSCRLAKASGSGMALTGSLPTVTGDGRTETRAKTVINEGSACCI